MKLDKEIENVNILVIMMCDIVKKNIFDAFSCFNEEQEVKEINDDIVNNYERLIEESCLDILVKERLYSRDLRIISGILKLVSDLERIGDHAEDIMEFTLKLRNETEKPCLLVEEMVTTTLEMVNDAIMSYINKDIELATKVIKADDSIDKMYIEAVDKLVNKESSREFAIYTTLVVKYIERIADHAVNIAEWVIYIVNGFYKDKMIF